MGSATLMLGSGRAHPQQLDAGADDMFVVRPVNLFSVSNALTTEGGATLLRALAAVMRGRREPNCCHSHCSSNKRRRQNEQDQICF